MAKKFNHKKKFKGIGNPNELKRATSKKYRCANKSMVPVHYKLVNGQVIINLKTIVDQILDDQAIAKYDVKVFDLKIPFSIDRQVTGNSIIVGIDNNRYTLLLKDLGIIPSKQQKIDYDNTHPHRWNNSQWAKYIESLFYDAYGFHSMSIKRGPNGGIPSKGAFKIKIDRMKETILNSTVIPTDHYSIVEYLRWVFAEKSSKVSLNIDLITCDKMIESWFIQKRRTLKKERSSEANKKKKKRKWD